jgi:NAD+ synthase (glutamine-hydrolysing)
VKIALATVNVRVGDFEANLKQAIARIEEAERLGARLILFPELSLVGYPSQDLFMRADFLEKAAKQLDELQEKTKSKDIAIVVGTALKSDGPHGAMNAAVFLHKGRREVRAKTLIPFYDVFNESRYFDSALDLNEKFRGPIEFEGKKFGLLVCEDSWHEMQLAGRKIYQSNPSKDLKDKGCEILLNLSASPFDKTKRERRRQTISAAARALGVKIFYVNNLGAHDELVFDGDAFAFHGDGSLIDEKPTWNNELLFVSTDKSGGKAKLAVNETADIQRALVLGIRDYLKKNGFQKVVLGLSGGIDSAVVAALAAEAIGPENVIALSMPSKVSSSHSIEDAEKLAANLGIRLKSFPIKFLFSTVHMALKPFFSGMPEDVTEENLQARLRGISVMAFANKFQALALATGNKSELAVGYSTLYGDMCGALMPIGDLYKTEVYELANYINKTKEVIPESSIRKPPSAELRAGQTDQDSLPPYDVLDAILFQLVDRELSVDAAFRELKDGELDISEDLVRGIQRSVRVSEYKRRQAGPILRMSMKAFGIGRRYPITGIY